MRLLSPASKRGRKWRSWWLQERRRSRLTETSSSPLLSGLVQFYQPTPGVTFFKSWNESASVPGNLYAGFVSPTEDLGSGNYQAGDDLIYQLHAYREVSGSRVYAGVAYQKDATATAASSGFNWPAWSSGPAWVTVISYK